MPRNPEFFLNHSFETTAFVRSYHFYLECKDCPNEPLPRCLNRAIAIKQVTHSSCLMKPCGIFDFTPTSRAPCFQTALDFRFRFSTRFFHAHEPKFGPQVTVSKKRVHKSVKQTTVKHPSSPSSVKFRAPIYDVSSSLLVVCGYAFLTSFSVTDARQTNPATNALSINHAVAGSGTGVMVMVVTVPKICCASVGLLNCMYSVHSGNPALIWA